MEELKKVNQTFDVARRQKKDLFDGEEEKDPNDLSNFMEYQEYLDLFADPNSNIRQPPKPKPGKNAKIFAEFYKENLDFFRERRA
mmetsp:Transcript_17795/g.15567  ORF Transcript_17795/g.15567 Transcript_17795/m.15567 type:complete len:85 (-) Transcript_17795:843-1097(-)